MESTEIICNTSIQFSNKLSKTPDTHCNSSKKINLTFKEQILFKSYVADLLYRRAKRLCRKYHEVHFNLGAQNKDEIMDNYLSYYLIQDLLDTGNFTIIGIANELRTHIDVITDIASGIKVNISPALLHRLIRLHVITKRTSYSNLIRRLLVILGYW